VTSNWEWSKVGSGHGPFTSTRPHSAERGKGFLDHQQIWAQTRWPVDMSFIAGRWLVLFVRSTGSGNAPAQKPYHPPVQPRFGSGETWTRSGTISAG
jgi:hypothetical protein